MIQLPNNKKCYNLPEQVAQNLANITYLAEEYKNIDELPSIWQSYKETFDAEQETFSGWTTTFEGWDTTLSTYLANMSSAAVGAIAGQNIAPANVVATTKVEAPLITGDEIVEKMSGYSYTKISVSNVTVEDVYAGIVKNGNKLTLVTAFDATRTDTNGAYAAYCNFGLPESVYNKLYPSDIGPYIGKLSVQVVTALCEDGTSVSLHVIVQQVAANVIGCYLAYGEWDLLTLNKKYSIRLEQTFLLSDNLAI